MLSELDLVDGQYVLSTVHRAGTVDDEQRLTRLVEALAALAEQTTVVIPMHPHTAKNIETWGLGDKLGKVRTIEPLPPKSFIGPEAGAALLVSDSGGVQEEACLFRRLAAGGARQHRASGTARDRRVRIPVVPSARGS